MLDFTRVRNKEQTLAELGAGLSSADLHRLSDEIVDAILGLIADAQDDDVIFQPSDPDAHDSFAANPAEVNLAWTLGHVIVHATASSEEAAALAAELARGVDITGRSRYETPWQTVHTVEQLHARLAESRRMRHAFLNAWPDKPDLTKTYTSGYPGAKPSNAITRFIAGLLHEDSHLHQIQEIMRQAREARGE